MQIYESTRNEIDWIKWSRNSENNVEIFLGVVEKNRKPRTLELQPCIRIDDKICKYSEYDQDIIGIVNSYIDMFVNSENLHK